MVPPLLVVPGPVPPPPRLPPVALAEALIRADRPLLAVQALTQLDRDDARVRRDLGRALASAGKCAEALPYLAEARHGPWTATDAYWEGMCHDRAGDGARAVAAWTEAVALDPGHAWSWYRLARAGDALGDPLLAADARDRLWTLEGGPLLTALADARRAVDAGDPEADWLLADLSSASRDPRASAEVALLDGRRWLDLGWPEAAVRALTHAVAQRPSELEAAVWLARAYVAAGDPDGARAALDRPWIALQDPTAELRALLATLP